MGCLWIRSISNANIMYLFSMFRILVRVLGFMKHLFIPLVAPLCFFLIYMIAVLCYFVDGVHFLSKPPIRADSVFISLNRQSHLHHMSCHLMLFQRMCDAFSLLLYSIKDDPPYLNFQTDGSVPNTLVIANVEVVKPRVAAAEHISQVISSLHAKSSLSIFFLQPLVLIWMFRI